MDPVIVDAYIMQENDYQKSIIMCFDRKLMTYTYFNDSMISVSPNEFIGLTYTQALNLLHEKEKETDTSLLML